MSATHPLATIAKLLMLTERRVQQLSAEGVIPKAERGRYELIPAVQGYIRYLKDRSLGADVPGDEYEHKRRLLKAKADLAEMEAAQLAGELVRTEVAESVWTDAASRFRQRALSVSYKAAPIVAVEMDPAVCHEIIESYLHEALAELAGTTVIGRADAGSSSSEAVPDGSATAEIDDLAMGGSEPETV